MSVHEWEDRLARLEAENARLATELAEARATIEQVRAALSPGAPKMLDIDPSVFAGLPSCSGCGSFFSGEIPETCPSCGGEVRR